MKRTVEQILCDRGGCRRRKGVTQVEVVMTIVKPDGENEINRSGGELCPAHIDMALDQVAGWFLNKKQYD